MRICCRFPSNNIIGCRYLSLTKVGQIACFEYIRAIDGLKELFARGLRYPIRREPRWLVLALFELAYSQKAEGYPLTLADIEE
jgi:hypothetical protein